MRYLSPTIKVVALHVISSFEFAIKMDWTGETLDLFADSHGIIQKKRTQRILCSKKLLHLPSHNFDFLSRTFDFLSYKYDVLFHFYDTPWAFIESKLFLVFFLSLLVEIRVHIFLFISPADDLILREHFCYKKILLFLWTLPSN